jgi:hypothetical protein
VNPVENNATDTAAKLALAMNRTTAQGEGAAFRGVGE